MEFIKKFRNEYEIRELTAAEFYPLLEQYGKPIFDDVSQFFRWQEVASEEQVQMFRRTRENLKGRYELSLGVYHNDEFVGWSTGYQDSDDTFYMMNSAVLPPHRGKGIYTELAKTMIERVVAQGFQKIFSRHVITNNAILISKLKLGFKITSFELSDRFGAMVHLSYFPMKIREKILDYRAGLIKPDAEINSALKLNPNPA